MRFLRHLCCAFLTVFLTACSEPAPAAQCPADTGVVLQVLGSGGPIADDGRASSAYVVWIDGKSVVLIDAGGGAFLRFGEAGANFAELDFIGLSHLHTDHSAGLPALLKSGYFSRRSRPLRMAGPDGSGPFPGLIAFLQGMLGGERGAYGYLSGYLDGSDGLARIDAVEISGDAQEPSVVFGDEQQQLQIDAMRVPHGIVPAVAYRVRIADTTIVFASDQNGDDPQFIRFAENATLLVMHMPVPVGVTGAGRRLHAPPGVIGRIANDAGVESLILSHFMARSLRNLEENVGAVRKAYPGRVVLANDLDCIIASP